MDPQQRLMLECIAELMAVASYQGKGSSVARHLIPIPVYASHAHTPRRACLYNLH
jgi:hypothetical protein